jgi:S1-C subfamily serine protease
MLDRWLKRSPQKHRFGFVFFLIGTGVLIGLIIASGLNWLPLGQAVSEQNSTQRVALPLPSNEQGFVAVAKQVTPVVVNVSTTRVFKNPGLRAPSSQDPFFRCFGENFFKQFDPRGTSGAKSLSSGVIASDQMAIFFK